MSSHRNSKGITARFPALLGCVLVLGPLLAGCSSEGSGDWSALIDIARQSWEQRDGAVPLSEASAIPFATLGVRMGGASERLLILATDSNGERLWTSAARVALTTRRGRIVATAGLGNDLSGYYSDTAFRTDWKSRRRIAWTADFADLGLYSVVIDCDDVPVGTEKIKILGREIITLRVDEKCQSSQLDWSFTNTYWVSQISDRVWRSIQHVHPKLETLEIELLRTPETEG